MSSTFKIQRSRFTVAIGVFAVVMAASVIFCAGPAVAEEKAAVESTVASKTLYYRLLARKPAATIEDAIRAISRYKGGSEELKPLAEELEFLKSKGVDFSKDIVIRKDDTLTIGSAAHMLMKAMGIKGNSAMYKWFPNNQRYAMKEAMAQGIVSPGSFIGQTLSGNDLMGMLVRVVEAGEAQKKK